MATYFMLCLLCVHLSPRLIYTTASKFKTYIIFLIWLSKTSFHFFEKIVPFLKRNLKWKLNRRNNTALFFRYIKKGCSDSTLQILYLSFKTVHVVTSINRGNNLTDKQAEQKWLIWPLFVNNVSGQMFFLTWMLFYL